MGAECRRGTGSTRGYGMAGINYGKPRKWRVAVPRCGRVTQSRAAVNHIRNWRHTANTFCLGSITAADDDWPSDTHLWPRMTRAPSGFTLGSAPTRAGPAHARQGGRGQASSTSLELRISQPPSTYSLTTCDLTSHDCVLRGGGDVAPPAGGAPDQDAGCGLRQPSACLHR